VAHAQRKGAKIEATARDRAAATEAEARRYSSFEGRP
jgi:hypothetical protein